MQHTVYLYVFILYIQIFIYLYYMYIVQYILYVLNPAVRSKSYTNTWCITYNANNAPCMVSFYIIHSYNIHAVRYTLYSVCITCTIFIHIYVDSDRV